MRFRLRYLQHDLELSEGQFVVGRNTTCQLSLDDPLVSRRHAMFVVSGDGVVVEDLQSRNGVLVNGEKIAAPRRLNAGDRVVIGGQELVLVHGVDGASLRSAAATTGAFLPRASGMPAPRALSFPSGAPGGAATVPPSSASHAVDSPPVASLSDPDGEISMLRRADAFKLLGGVAEKAMAMGRAGEAERLLASPLGDVIEACRSGRILPPALVDQAARFSAKLATATGKGGWADYVIELYAAQMRPCPASVTDELYNAMRKITSIDLVRLRGYVEQLRTRVASFGPAERFQLHRIEGLERLAALR